MGPHKWVCASVFAIFEQDAAKARGRAREHLNFYVNQENYRRLLIAQGFTAADLENRGSDRLIDADVAWGSEDKIMDRINAQIDAGANHVCAMPLRSDSVALPDERLLEALAPH